MNCNPATLPKEVDALKRNLLLTLSAVPLLFLLAPSAAVAQEVGSIVVSIPEQRLYVFDDAGHRMDSYRISTSQFGLGDAPRSYATPTGQLEIAAKIGAGATPGQVFHHCRPTGEVCAVNARGRDPIVTRILPLRGLEKQNAHAFSRGIFIHGTPDERHIGRPVSYGCIRMRSKDVLELFDLVQPGTKVEITTERVGGLFGNATRPPADRG
jgi:lipoprotein-anchoring transpeptidase ErfK/SrfK